jgi:hypothetical protein
MVSNVLNLSPEELLEALRGFAAQYSDDPEYRELRAPLPADWPI